MEEDKRIYILSKEKPAKAVVKLGVPLIAGMFIMVLYNLVDTTSKARFCAVFTALFCVVLRNFTLLCVDFHI